MIMSEIRLIARDHGVRPGKMIKTELVRCIQHNEGNFECFATAANGECNQKDCLWRKDCFAAAKKQPVS